MPGIIRNITKIERDGIKYFTSGAQYVPTTSASSVPQIIAVTCSADSGNNLATTSSLSGYFIVPLVSQSGATLGSNLNVFYVTASIFDFVEDADTGATASGTPSYFNPTSSNTVTNFNVPVRIEKNETANNVALKTYNAITGSTVLSRFVSSSISGDKLILNNIISGALDSPFISASGFNFNYVQSGSFGSGSSVNYKPPVGFLPDTSASFTIKRDDNDEDSVKFAKLVNNVQEPAFYLSGSGRIGFNTDDPRSGLDAVVDEVQFQRPGARKGLKINQDGNIESFDKDPTTASTGSEFLLRFSRGTAITKASLEAIGLGPFADDAAAQSYFNALRPAEQNAILERIESIGFIDPPQVGDTLGSIRWVAESGSTSGYDDRSTGETAVIKAVVSDGDATGIQADMIFSVAGKTGAAEQKFLLDASNTHQLTGSLNINGGLTATSTANFNGTANFDSNIVGDLISTNIQNVNSITGYGNLSMGNNGNEVHQLTGDVYIKRVASDGGDLLFQTSGDTKLKISHDGNITASGNISASGTITADTLTSNNIVFTPSATSIKIEAPDETAGSVNGASLTIEAGNAFGSNFNGGDVTIQAGKGSGAGDGGNIVINAGGGIPSGSISLNAPSIIASGNISASGDLSIQGFPSVSASLAVAGGINTGSFATTGSNTFIGDQIISGALFISGSTELGGDIFPQTPQGATLGTIDKPFSDLFLQSGSISIESDTPGDPSAVISNTSGNLEISVGGMLLVEPGNSFIAETGSFQHISGSLTQVGDYTRTGDTIAIGDFQTTGSISITGSFSADLEENNVWVGDNGRNVPKSFVTLANEGHLIRPAYGSFYDTTTQSGSANTAYAIKHNTTDFGDGVSIVSETRITMEEAGIYTIISTQQFSHTSGGEVDITGWLRKNGTDVVNSATDLRLKGNGEAELYAINYFVSASAGDYYEMMWSPTDSTTIIKAIAARTSPTRPAVLSVRKTVNRERQ